MATLPDVIHEYLQTFVQQRAPERLLFIGDAPDTTRLQRNSRASTVILSADQSLEPTAMRNGERFDLAVVINGLARLPRPAGNRLLGQLRDTRAAGVLVVTGPTTPDQTVWNSSDFIALGFRRSANSRYIAPGWAIYRYDIHDYKTTPGWLNSRYWANPERWDDDRW
ncbi:DUF6231 family protein [Salinisphaera aquimarina]|uniref:DUF6231 family protein n=1 Tax=Salinisphaera aquimarina TaxID=2094031 RepID=A0ABV7ERP5_9GAMM